MSFITDQFDRTVLEFMKDCPFTAQYVQYTNGAYNPATASVTQSKTTTDVQAILLDLTLSSNGFSTRFGTLIQAGDKELFVRPPHKADPTGLTPPLVISPADDRVLVNGIEYKIVTYKEINPTGADPILYDLYIRR